MNPLTPGSSSAKRIVALSLWFMSSSPGHSPRLYCKSKTKEGGQKSCGVSLHVPPSPQADDARLAPGCHAGAHYRSSGRKNGSPRVTARLAAEEQDLQGREGIEQDVAHDLEASRRQLVERVLRRMPVGLVVEVDDQGRGDSGLEKRDVVILHGEGLVQEVGLVAEPA